jgi:hypothetical protein
MTLIFRIVSFVGLTLVLSCEPEASTDFSNNISARNKVSDTSAPILTSAKDYYSALGNASWEATRITMAEFSRKLDGLCNDSAIGYEITDLYPDSDTLYSATEERLRLDDTMKKHGFTAEAQGWGNWQNGPRMVNMRLESPRCTCLLTKLYYSNGASKKHSLSTTEKIACMKKIKVISDQAE